MPTLCKQERLFEERLLSMLFDKGKRFMLTNLSNNLAYELGTYNMNFEEGTFTIIEEDIDQAFAIVDGLVKEDPPAAEPQSPEPEPDPNPEPQQDEDNESSEESEE